MNTFSHLGMSVAIKKAVEKQLNIKLDTFGFMYGNVKPDISSYLINIPHFKSQAADFVASEIEELMKYKIDRYGKCSKEFSERLGVVTHYLSDFFCYAHSKHFKGSLLKHYIYEARLSGFCKRYSGAMRQFNYIRYLNFNFDHKSICGLIDRLHEKYEQKRPSYANDLTFALRTCISLSISILVACLAENLELAA